MAPTQQPASGSEMPRNASDQAQAAAPSPGRGEPGSGPRSREARRAVPGRRGTPQRILGRVKKVGSGLMRNPRFLSAGMSLWPPFLGAGIVVEHLDPQWRSATVRLRRSRLNANYVGTQFGGSLFSMADPFFMLLIINRLGRDHVVWDKAGEIEFLSPGRTAVRAHFEVTDEQIEDLRRRARGGEKVLEWFETDIVDAHGTAVARYRKQVYVRAKPPREAGA